MTDLGNLQNWTKLDLARVIVQALFNLNEPPSPTNIHVKRRARQKKTELVHFAQHAIEILNKRR